MSDTSPITITRESPLSPELSLLMARHKAAMHAETPPESIHMMEAAELAAADVDFFVMRDGARPVGMGAYKRIDPAHAEIKSMHVLAEERGRGLARVMLDHLTAAAAGPAAQPGGASNWSSISTWSSRR
jgi:putative acetyltransferase